MKKLISYILTFLIIATSCNVVFASARENDETTLFSGGTGTKEDPYIVSTATDVLNIANHLDCYFLQVGDVSFQGEEHTPIGTYESPFTGNYNGNGFSIKDISFESKDTEYSGLFGYSRGTISNVKLKNCSFNVSSNTATLYCGAIAGYNSGTISSCVVDADIKSSTKGEGISVYAGGISGYSTQKLKNCLFDGEVTSTVSYIDSIAYSGGIVANGSAQDCTNHGNISSIASVSSDAYAGGIVAITRNSIENCYNDGNIVAKNANEAYAGGISGKSQSSIKSCKNDGSVYANTKYSYSETYSGGISGMNRSTISYCINTGKIDADSTSSHVRVGGIAGYNYSSVQDSKNYGTISGYATSYESHIGGIVGTSYSGSYVRRCCNNGKVSTTDNGSASLGSAGGIVGLLQYGTTLQCCNHGEVLGIQNVDKLSCYVGGVVGGTSDCTIIDCYNTGKVLMDYKGNRDWSAGACGGIYGESDSSCAYCYNTGELKATSEYSEIGGIQGLGNSANANSLEYCYALDIYDDPYAIEMSDTESKLKETYAGFDFENVWAIAPSINDGRPYIATIPNDDNENWYSNNNIMVSLSSSSTKLGIGKEKTLSVISDLESEDLIWTTSDSDIVTVDDGVIAAVAKGTAIITVSSLDKIHIASCVISVVDGNVFSISGKISSYGDNSNVKIELLETGDTVTIKDSNNYQINDVFPGAYTIRVSKSKHCTREYTVVVSDSDVMLDLEIWLYGDVNADGTVNHIDVLQINRNIASQTSVFDAGTDELKAYRFNVANVTAINGSDAELNHIDVLQINRKIANLTSIFDSLE